MLTLQDMYTLDANFMAGLTDEEQKQYYGKSEQILTLKDI